MVFSTQSRSGLCPEGLWTGEFAGRPGEQTAALWAGSPLMVELGSESRPCGPQRKGGGHFLQGTSARVRCPGLGWTLTTDHLHWRRWQLTFVNSGFPLRAPRRQVERGIPSNTVDPPLGLITTPLHPPSEGIHSAHPSHPLKALH